MSITLSVDYKYTVRFNVSQVKVRCMGLNILPGSSISVAGLVHVHLHMYVSIMTKSSTSLQISFEHHERDQTTALVSHLC